MSPEPDSLILELLRGLRAELGEVRAEMSDMHAEMVVKSDMQSLRADVVADLLAAEARSAAEHKQTREQIVGLRRAIVDDRTPSSGTAS